MKRVNIDEEFVKHFNTLRIQYAGQKLPKEKLKDLFKKELDLRVDSTWLSKLCEFGILEKIKSGNKRGYIFSYKPTYIEKLKNVYCEVCKTRKKYAKSLITEVVEILNPEEEAIKLLKKLGYKILKPVINYEEL